MNPKDRHKEDPVEALHVGLARVLQGMFEEHGIQVVSVHAEWTDVSHVGKPRSLVLGKLTLETQSRSTRK